MVDEDWARQIFGVVTRTAHHFGSELDIMVYPSPPNLIWFLRMF